MSATPFFGGIPTKIDTDKLRAVFGVPEEGKLITHEQYEAALGMKRTECRFKTVRKAWHTILQTEHRCVMGSVPDKGYVRLKPDELVQHCADKEKCGFRTINRAQGRLLLADTNRITPDNRKLYSAMTERHAAIRLAVATSAKALKAPDISK